MIYAWLTGHTVTVLPCSSSLEYPRSNLSPKVRFVGGAPREELDPSTSLPPWWGDLEANKATQSGGNEVLAEGPGIKLAFKRSNVRTRI